MLSILTKRGRLCDTLSRRELITVGGLSMVGLSLPTVFSRQSLARDASKSPTGSGRSGFGRAKGVILLYLQGSPSHIDLWDPKPAAPATIRGEFKPVATNVTGDDPVTTGKIARAHLNEFPDYYARLEQMEEQAKREAKT